MLQVVQGVLIRQDLEESPDGLISVIVLSSGLFQLGSRAEDGVNDDLAPIEAHLFASQDSSTDVQIQDSTSVHISVIEQNNWREESRNGRTGQN